MNNFKKLLGGAFLSGFAFLGLATVKAENYKISEFKEGDTILSNSYEFNGQKNVYYPTVSAETIYDEQTHVAADTGDGYVSLQSWYYSNYNLEDRTLSFKLKGSELDASKNYIVSMKSDYIDSEKKYTGDELNNGVVVTIEDTYGKVSVTVTEESSKEVIKYNYNSCDGVTGECDSETAQTMLLNKVNIEFNSFKKLDYTKLNEIFAKIAPNGVIELNCIEPQDDDFTESMITAALPASDEYELFGYIDEDGKHKLNIELYSEDGFLSKTYDVTYKFKEANTTVSSVVAKVVEKLKYDYSELRSDYNKRFIVEDLESINYLYNTQKTKNEIAALNSIVNYSSKIHELADNINVDFMFDIRAGGSESEFTDTFVGPMNILYDGIIYKNIDPIGYALTKIIYVPDDTVKTRDAFIAAAKARISEYVSGIDVDITYGGKIEDLDEVQYSWEKISLDDDYMYSVTYAPLFDMDKTNGEWYNVKIGDKEYKYFIVADSSKIVNPTVKTKDTSTNISVSTDAFDAPLDSKVSVLKVAADTDLYKQIASKFSIVENLVYDVNLYSTSLEMYISKLANGKFKVYIPVSDATAKKDLVAVYLKEDGTAERHPITFENGYAIFETDHFSTYAIVDNNIKNPKTGDNYTILTIILGASIIGVFGSALYIVKKKKSIKNN